MAKKVNGQSLHDLIRSCVNVAVAVQAGGDAVLEDSVISLAEFAILGWQDSDPDPEPAPATPNGGADAGATDATEGKGLPTHPAHAGGSGGVSGAEPRGSQPAGPQKGNLAPRRM